MEEKIIIDEIFEKNINVLLGSGASVGLFPTLKVAVKGNDGTPQTIETLATYFKDDRKKYSSVFMHYYKTCIKPVIDFSYQNAVPSPSESEVLENYETFLKKLITLLQRRTKNRRVNIFSTNYDGCVECTADKIWRSGAEDFIMNDGARGFMSKSLDARNFQASLFQSGIFERHQSEIPQINLMHLHGSIFWRNEDGKIDINYQVDNLTSGIDLSVLEKNQLFSQSLDDDQMKVSDLPDVDIDDSEADEFLRNYEALPIVNPTKWKFHETVFEEHYYQLLRVLSYELEKPNSILVTFGFSFADEHILNIIRRSLSNPSLQLFVCCFNDEERRYLHEKFKLFKNVKLITVEGNLTFTEFNKDVFVYSSEDFERSVVSHDE